MQQTADSNSRVVLAERPHGLPDAKTIKNTEGAKAKPADDNVVDAEVKEVKKG